MTELVIGFIPLADAATLLIAVDKGFCAAEGLDVELVREVSWSNIRDKLNIGVFDAAHLIAPVAIASSLGLGHIKVPIIAPFGLGVNGNAITVSPALYQAIKDAAAWLGSVEIIYSSGALQYTPDREAKIRELCAVGADRMEWRRVLLSSDVTKADRQLSLLGENGPGYVRNFKGRAVSFPRVALSRASFLALRSSAWP